MISSHLKPEKSRKQRTTPEFLTSKPLSVALAHATGRLSQMKPSIAEVAGLLERDAKAEGQRDGHVNGPALPEAQPALSRTRHAAGRVDDAQRFERLEAADLEEFKF